MKFTLSNRYSMSVVAVVAALTMSPMAAYPVSAQVAIEISDAALASALAGCASADECNAAIQSLVNDLAAANPDADLSLIIASVISAVAAGYNAGTIPAVAAQFAIASAGSIAASNGLTELAAVAVAAAATVAAGDPVNLEAVAEASGSPA